MSDNDAPSTASARPSAKRLGVDIALECLFERLADAVVAVAGDTIVLWNQAAERLFGYTKAEALGLPAASLMPESARALYLAELRRAEESVRARLDEQRLPVELPALRRSGEEFWIELSSSVVEASPGSEPATLLIIRDMTARWLVGQQAARAKNAKAELAERTRELETRLHEREQRISELQASYERAHEQKLEAERQLHFAQKVINKLPGGVNYMLKNLVLQLVNEKWAEQFGGRPSDFNGKHVTEVFPANIVEQVASQLEQVLEQGQPVSVVGLPITTHDAHGQPITTYRDVVAIPMLDEHGEVEGSLSLGFDATERVRLEQALAERSKEVERQSALLKSVINHVPAGIAYLDRDLVVRWLNPEYARLSQRTQDYYLDRYLFAEVPAEFRDRFEPDLKNVFVTGQPYSAKGRPYIRLQDGKPHEMFWDFNYAPVFDGEQQVVGILIFALEVSERIEKERLQAERIQALEQADALKDQFLTILSHELRTPLNAILGFASVLDDEVLGPLTLEQHTYLGKILGGSEILLALINDLLDMGRIQAGKFSLSPGPMSLGKSLEAVVGNLSDAADKKELSVDYELPAELPELFADEQRVSQVLYNLIFNAIKFTAPGGRIRIRMELKGDEIQCEVIDTGIGIVENDIPKLFQRFQQLDGSNTRQAGGTGLGLSISKALVEAHGGQIGVSSKPGSGSTFWFSLPLGSTSATRPALP